VGGFDRTQEIWRYGTNGHLTWGTLGQVYIDQNGEAQYVYGGHGEPPPRGMFQEDELRQLLRVIDQVPSPMLEHFDPRKLIVAVNALQALVHCHTMILG
jgi:hypothetical protein